MPRTMLLLLSLWLFLASAEKLSLFPRATHTAPDEFKSHNYPARAAVPSITQPARLNDKLLLRRDLATCGFVSGNPGMCLISTRDGDMDKEDPRFISLIQ